MLTLFMEPLVPPPKGPNENMLPHNIAAAVSIPASDPAQKATSTTDADPTIQVRDESQAVPMGGQEPPAHGSSMTGVQTCKTDNRQDARAQTVTIHASCDGAAQACFSCGVSDHRVLRICRGCKRHYPSYVTE